MPDDTLQTEVAPVTENLSETSPQTSEQTPQESSSNDSMAVTATEGESVSKALEAFSGQGFRVNPPKLATETQDGQTQEPPAQPARQSRDYSGLDEAEQKIFKSMSNDAFALLKPQYLESKKLKAEHEELKQKYDTASKATFYDQDGAYQLTPDYQFKSANLQLVDREITFWKQQISAIRNGQKWTALTGYDKDGNAILAPDQEPSPEAEADIVDALINARSIRSGLAKEVDSIKENFSVIHKQYLSNMSAIEKEIFKGVDAETLNKAMSKKITMFPEHRRSNPEVQVIAKLLAVLDGYQMLISERTAEKVSAEQKTKTAVNGGPTGGVTQKTLAGKGNTAGAAIDEFNAYKARSGW